MPVRKSCRFKALMVFQIMTERFVQKHLLNFNTKIYLGKVRKRTIFRMLCPFCIYFSALIHFRIPKVDKSGGICYNDRELKKQLREVIMKSNDKKELLRTLKFTLFSISAGIIQVGLFTLLNELLSLDYWVSYITSLVASILWNFTINRKVTFKASNNVALSMLLVFLFYLVFTPVSTVLGQMAEDKGVNEYIVLAVTLICNFVLEYLYTRYVVYRNSCDTAGK